MTEQRTEAYEGWAIVELFGHKRLAGRVSQAEQYGQAMLRLDVPHRDGSESTHFYGGSSLYGVHPTTEDVARHIAAACDPSPVQRWELPALPAPSGECDDDHEFDPDDYQDGYMATHCVCGDVMPCDCDSDEDEEQDTAL